MARSNRPVPSAAAPRGGFTLVELLVVIGIIALLISILLPALNRARGSANMTKCASNLRSIGQAFQLYAVANKGSLPIGNTNKWGPGANEYTNWAMMLLNTLDPKVNLTNMDVYGPGALRSSNDSKSRSLFLCPEVPGQSTSPNAIEITHYLGNPRLLPIYGEAEPASSPLGARPQRPAYKLAKVKRSAEVCISFDGSLTTPYTAYMSAPDPDLYGPGENSPLAKYMDNGAFGYGQHFIFDASRPPAGTSFTSGVPINMQPNGGGTGTLKDFNQDTLGNKNNIRFRHMKDTKCNALALDGHVMVFTLKNNPTAGGAVVWNATDAKRENFYVNRP